MSVPSVSPRAISGGDNERPNPLCHESAAPCSVAPSGTSRTRAAPRRQSTSAQCAVGYRDREGCGQIRHRSVRTRYFHAADAVIIIERVHDAQVRDGRHRELRQIFQDLIGVI